MRLRVCLMAEIKRYKSHLELELVETEERERREEEEAERDDSE